MNNYRVYVVCIMQMQPSRGVLRKRSSGNMHQIYRRTPVPNCDFNKVALLSCKFAVYFQNTFSKKHLWTAASDSVKTRIWSKSVIKKLQFDERSNSLGCQVYTDYGKPPVLFYRFSDWATIVWVHFYEIFQLLAVWWLELAKPNPKKRLLKI